MSDIYMESAGPVDGVPVVLLHGWGLHGGVWSPLVQQLEPRLQHIGARLLIPDLPGHGHSPWHESRNTLAAWVWEIRHAVAQATTVPALWIGWSLGALVALGACAGLAARGLVMIGSNIVFSQRADWHAAMAPAVLADFATGLQDDYEATLNRFVGLQFGPGPSSRERLRDLKSTLFARGQPDIAALRTGLDILATSDLRTTLGDLDVALGIIQGTHDRLVPPAAAEAMAALNPAARLLVIDKAGHAPHLSHPDRVAGFIEEFIHE